MRADPNNCGVGDLDPGRDVDLRGPYNSVPHDKKMRMLTCSPPSRRAFPHYDAWDMKDETRTLLFNCLGRRACTGYPRARAASQRWGDDGLLPASS